MRTSDVIKNCRIAGGVDASTIHKSAFQRSCSMFRPDQRQYASFPELSLDLQNMDLHALLTDRRDQLRVMTVRHRR